MKIRSDEGKYWTALDKSAKKEKRKIFSELILIPFRTLRNQPPELSCVLRVLNRTQGAG
jgi:hypothetical protein